MRDQLAAGAWAVSLRPSPGACVSPIATAHARPAAYSPTAADGAEGDSPPSSGACGGRASGGALCACAVGKQPKEGVLALRFVP